MTATAGRRATTYERIATATAATTASSDAFFDTVEELAAERLDAQVARVVAGVAEQVRDMAGDPANPTLDLLDDEDDDRAAAFGLLHGTTCDVAGWTMAGASQAPMPADRAPVSDALGRLLGASRRQASTQVREQFDETTVLAGGTLGGVVAQSLIGAAEATMPSGVADVSRDDVGQIVGVWMSLAWGRATSRAHDDHDLPAAVLAEAAAGFTRLAEHDPQQQLAGMAGTLEQTADGLAPTSFHDEVSASVAAIYRHCGMPGLGSQSPKGRGLLRRLFG